MMKADPNALYIDTLQGAPQEMVRFQPWNPFFFHHDALIPVPGTSLLSESVEGIWQGLKLVDGVVDLGQLKGLPSKRPSEEVRGADTSYQYSTSRFSFAGGTLI